MSDPSNPQKRPAEEPLDDGERRKRKKRWGAEEEKVLIPGFRTTLPSGLDGNTQDLLVMQLRIDEITRMLTTNDLRIDYSDNRSPSPPPEYDGQGKRKNTREQRVRDALTNERDNLVEQLARKNPMYKPPVGYKPRTTKKQRKIFIPQDEHPEINFMGLIIGPRGTSLKKLESETGAKVSIRGKGSEKEGKSRGGMPAPGSDEKMHCLVTCDTEEGLNEACRRIDKLLVPIPEGENDRKRDQLRLLAALNGTLREQENCRICGSTTHKQFDCPDRGSSLNANIQCFHCQGKGHISSDCPLKKAQNSGAPGDSTYASFMGSVGGGAPAAAGSAARPEDSAYAAFMSAVGDTAPRAPVAAYGTGANAYGQPASAPYPSGQQSYGGYPPAATSYDNYGQGYSQYPQTGGYDAYGGQGGWQQPPPPPPDSYGNQGGQGYSSYGSAPPPPAHGGWNQGSSGQGYDGYNKY